MSLARSSRSFCDDLLPRFTVERHLFECDDHAAPTRPHAAGSARHAPATPRRYAPQAAARWSDRCHPATRRRPGPRRCRVCYRVPAPPADEISAATISLQPGAVERAGIEAQHASERHIHHRLLPRRGLLRRAEFAHLAPAEALEGIVERGGIVNPSTLKSSRQNGRRGLMTCSAVWRGSPSGASVSIRTA